MEEKHDEIEECTLGVIGDRAPVGSQNEEHPYEK
jgi:hypothetical protein